MTILIQLSCYRCDYHSYNFESSTLEFSYFVCVCVCACYFSGISSFFFYSLLSFPYSVTMGTSLPHYGRAKGQRHLAVGFEVSLCLGFEVFAWVSDIQETV
jgi:hypothetical protein